MMNRDSNVAGKANRDDEGESTKIVASASRANRSQEIQSTTAKLPAAFRSPDVAKPAAKRKEKPRDKPKRHLSAYNIFFLLTRQRILRGDEDKPITAEEIAELDITRRDEDKPRRQHRKTHGKISFSNLASTIAGKWKELDPDLKGHFEERATEDKIRYAQELDRWHAQQGELEEEQEDMKPAAQPLLMQTQNPAVAATQAVIDGPPRQQLLPFPMGQVYQEAFPGLSVAMNPGIAAASNARQAVPTYLSEEEQFFFRRQLQRAQEQEQVEAALRLQLEGRVRGPTERQFLNLYSPAPSHGYASASPSGPSGHLPMGHPWGSSSLSSSELVALATRQAYLEGRESALRAQQTQLMRSTAAVPSLFLPLPARHGALPYLGTAGRVMSGPSQLSPASAAALLRQLQPQQSPESKQWPQQGSPKQPPPG